MRYRDEKFRTLIKGFKVRLYGTNFLELNKTFLIFIIERILYHTNVSFIKVPKFSTPISHFLCKLNGPKINFGKVEIG